MSVLASDALSLERVQAAFKGGLSEDYTVEDWVPAGLRTQEVVALHNDIVRLVDALKNLTIKTEADFNRWLKQLKAADVSSTPPSVPYTNNLDLIQRENLRLYRIHKLPDHERLDLLGDCRVAFSQQMVEVSRCVPVCLQAQDNNGPLPEGVPAVQNLLGQCQPWRLRACRVEAKVLNAEMWKLPHQGGGVRLGQANPRPTE